MAVASTRPPAGLRAALVDLDGTLVDTVGDFVAVLQATLHALPAPYAQHTVSADWVRHTVGQGTEHLVRSLLQHIAPVHEAAAADALLAQALAIYHQQYPRINGRYVQVYDGVHEGLARMQAWGWPLVCVTNKPTAFAQALLGHLGLDGFFAFTLGGDACARKKPDPEPLLVACQRLGLPPAQVVMLGDSSNDAQAARAAGCPVVLMRYGYNHGQPVESAGADGLADRLDAIDWQAWA